MDISVTAFKQRCLKIIRQVERTGAPVAITRRGRVVAQLRRWRLGMPPLAYGDPVEAMTAE